MALNQIAIPAFADIDPDPVQRKRLLITQKDSGGSPCMSREHFEKVDCEREISHGLIETISAGSRGMTMTEFIYGTVDGVGKGLSKYAVLTMEVPWNLVRQRIGGTPTSVTFVSSLEEAYLDELVRNIPAVDTSVGIGGGVAIDAAKYLAWKRQIPLVLVPTITSVDAYISPEIAVRRQGFVNYLGKVSPTKTIFDLRAIQSAPKRLNTAGAGDIYSCRTAIFDWKLSHEKTGEPYDPEIASKSRQIVEKLVANSDDIKNVTEKGIRTLVQLYLEVHRLIALAGNSRPEEGTEHTFFYALERLTGRAFVHGQTVGTGIFVVSHLQSNEGETVAKDMDKMGLMFRPKDYDLSKEEFIKAVLEMKPYSKSFKLPFSILDVAEISARDAEGLWNQLSN